MGHGGSGMQRSLVRVVVAKSGVSVNTEIGSAPAGFGGRVTDMKESSEELEISEDEAEEVEGLRVLWRRWRKRR